MHSSAQGCDRYGGERGSARAQQGGEAVGLVGASRGDPLTRHLFDAIDRRYGMVGRVDAELRPWQQYVAALATFRPSRARWGERYWKSLLAFRIRSRNSGTQLASIGQPYHAVLQVHALFRTRGAPYLLYVDNTHQQSVQGWPVWNPLRGRDLERWYAHERATYEGALHIFTMAEPAARSLVEFYGIPRERVSNVGGGANFETLPTLSDSVRRPVILFVGHDFARKGGDRLLAAFRRVRAQMPEARLQIVGTSAVPAEPGVEVLGRIDDRRRVADLYAQASIFCLPSYFEPYGLVLMEAMAHGLPCVSTHVCGIPEIVTEGEAGLLVPAGDSAALAAALLRLLQDPAYAARLGAAGRRRVEQHLNWDRVVERMAPVLDRLGRVHGPAQPIMQSVLVGA